MTIVKQVTRLAPRFYSRISSNVAPARGFLYPLLATSSDYFISFFFLLHFLFILKQVIGFAIFTICGHILYHFLFSSILLKSETLFFIAGFSGKDCEIDHSCQLNGCKNGGVCRSIDKSNYICFCEPNFTGKSCETQLRNPLSYTVTK